MHLATSGLGSEQAVMHSREGAGWMLIRGWVWLGEGRSSGKQIELKADQASRSNQGGSSKDGLSKTHINPKQIKPRTADQAKDRSSISVTNAHEKKSAESALFLLPIVSGLSARA